MRLRLYFCEKCGIVRAMPDPPDEPCREAMLTVRGDGEVGFTRCLGVLLELTLGDFLTAARAAAVEQVEPTDTRYLCTVCHREPVDSDAGYDTCDRCARAI
jgi:hypothetical protein